MSKVYGRRYDLYSVSKEILDSDIPEYVPSSKIVSYEDVVNSNNVLEMYLSPRAIEILEGSKIVVSRNVLLKKPHIIRHDGIIQSAELIMPHYRFREEDKITFISFLGNILTNLPESRGEFGTLIPLMLEYFYLSKTKEDGENIFTHSNLNKRISEAKKFVASCDKYDKDPEKYELHDFESYILDTMNSFSSFEATLELINQYQQNPDKVLSLVDDMILQKSTIKDAVSEAGISTYGYGSLRKVLREPNKFLKK